MDCVAYEVGGKFGTCRLIANTDRLIHLLRGGGQRPVSTEAPKVKP